MSKTKIIKRLFSLTACAIVAFNIAAITASAETRDYDITVTRSGSNQDPYSYKTNKAGGSSWDNYAYVRNSSFSGTGTIGFLSAKTDYGTPLLVVAGPIAHSDRTIGTSKNAAYTSTAPANKYYTLQGQYQTGSQSSTLRIKGKYTP